MNTLFMRIIDVLVPFGILLRSSTDLRPFERWGEILWRFLPQTFFVYWLFSFVPLVGGLIYMLVLVPMSLALGKGWQVGTEGSEFAHELLVYLTVILIGFGGIWSFIGHAFLADQIAIGIGWQPGSPFQTELAFYTLGSGVAGLLGVWLRGHLITALVVSKSIFWYGAAFVHINDALQNQNHASLNIGAPLLGDLIYPTVLLVLLARAHKSGRTTRA